MIKLTKGEVARLVNLRRADINFENVDIITKAQIKKMVEWVPQDCTEHKHTVRMMGKDEPVDVRHCDCPECWQALLKEIENEL